MYSANKPAAPLTRPFFACLINMILKFFWGENVWMTCRVTTKVIPLSSFRWYSFSTLGQSSDRKCTMAGKEELFFENLNFVLFSFVEIVMDIHENYWSWKVLYPSHKFIFLKHQNALTWAKYFYPVLLSFWIYAFKVFHHLLRCYCCFYSC